LQGAITKETSDRTAALAGHDDSDTAHAKIRATINNRIGRLEEFVPKIDEKLDADEKGAANGVATLDENGEIPASQLPNTGNGLMAVTADDTLKGNGTSTAPLGLADDLRNVYAKQVIALTEDNQEAYLAGIYGGTWHRVNDPKPSILKWVPSVVLGNTAIPPGNFTIPNLAYGNFVTVSLCRDGNADHYPPSQVSFTMHVELISSTRGKLQEFDETGTNYNAAIFSFHFNTVQIQANEVLSVYVNYAMMVVFIVNKNLQPITITEYLYFRE